MNDQDNPFQPLTKLWVEKIRLAQTHKKSVFGDTAEECMAFFDDCYEMMYGVNAERKRSALNTDINEARPQPTFGMVINKVAEFVRIFGPYLYNRNPVRTVNPRKIKSIDMGILDLGQALLQVQQMGPMMDPMFDPMMIAQQVAMQQAQQREMSVQANVDLDRVRSDLLDGYLNWTPEEFSLKRESRRAIDEALIKGRGTLWTELKDLEDGGRAVGSFFDTVNSLLIDPDASSLDEALWIAKECIHPVWQVEQDYGLAPGSLKANITSAEGRASNNADEFGKYKSAQGRSNDLLKYWKIWTKMGVGDRLSSANKDLAGQFDQFVDKYAYLVVADDCEYFLNLPPEISSQPMDENVAAMITQAFAWPTPCWGLLGKNWPVVTLDFYEVPDSAWPQAPIKPALGELKAIQWIMSFLVGKIRTTCRDLIAVAKSAAPEFKETVLNGKDLALLEIDQQHPGTIDELVKFIQHPQINGDVWKVLEALMDLFDKRVGMTDLMYGESRRQLRSASEAQLKGDHVSVRPDDMADRVEDWASEIAEREACFVRSHLQGQDVARVIGQPYVQAWDQYVFTGGQPNMTDDLEYRIEQGSAKRPNRDRDISVLDETAHVIFPALIQFSMATGQIGPVNAWMAAYWRSRGFDPTPFQITPPPPPPPPEEAGATGEEGSEGESPKKKKEEEAPQAGPPQEEQAPPQGQPPAMPQLPPEVLAMIAGMPMQQPDPGGMIPLGQTMPVTPRPMFVPGLDQLMPFIGGMPPQ